MTVFAIVGAVYSVAMTLFVIMVLIRLAVLERDVARLKQRSTPGHPAIRGRCDCECASCSGCLG